VRCQIWDAAGCCAYGFGSRQGERWIALVDPYIRRSPIDHHVDAPAPGANIRTPMPPNIHGQWFYQGGMIKFAILRCEELQIRQGAAIALRLAVKHRELQVFMRTGRLPYQRSKAQPLTIYQSVSEPPRRANSSPGGGRGHTRSAFIDRFGGPSDWPSRLMAPWISFRKVGHSICDDAEQSAIWRSVSRSAVSSAIC
jgi:hypothetical protein